MSTRPRPRTAFTPLSTHDDSDGRILRWMVYALLAYVFVTGGSSQQSGWDDTLGQWLALPVLGMALLAMAMQPPSPLRRWGLIAAGAIALVPVLQLLPLPASVWSWPAARQGLARDLATTGASMLPHWTLSPSATERAALSLLPALAAFTGCLALGSRAHRRCLRLFMALALVSLGLAFAQLGVPQESVLNPFPQWTPVMGGVFANPNHQAAMLVVAAGISLVMLVINLRQWRETGRQAWKPWVLGMLLLFFVGALPLTNSRSGAIIALLALTAAAWAAGLFRLRTWASKRAMLVTAIGLAIATLGLIAAIGWMRTEEVGDLRGPLRRLTLEVGNAHAPLGAGVGSFVPVFEQGAPRMALRDEYINHAHNEYLQLWLEAGWLALLAALAAFAVLAAAAIKLALRSPADRAIGGAALIGVGVVLAQSFVDFPLRTPALMSVAAALAGIAVAQAARSRQDDGAQGAGRDLAR